MRKGTAYTVLLLAGITIGVRTSTAEVRPGLRGTMNANVTLGRRWLSDRSGWQGFTNHDAWGLRFDYRGAAWPVSVAADFEQSVERRDGTIVDEKGKELTGHIRAQTLEGDFGIRKVWDRNPGARPYVGGGLAIIRSLLVKSEVPDLYRGSPFAWAYKADEGSAGIGTGFWLNSGIYWTFDAMDIGYKWLNLGIDTRFTWARGPLFDHWIDYGGFAAAVFAGTHW